MVGYNPWGRKESDTTEPLHFHFKPWFDALQAKYIKVWVNLVNLEKYTSFSSKSVFPQKPCCAGKGQHKVKLVWEILHVIYLKNSEKVFSKETGLVKKHCLKQDFLKGT